jgi:hypothetical protein
MSRIDETTGATAFASLATIVVLSSFLFLFSKSFGLVFFGQQERGYGAVRFRDNPQLVVHLEWWVCASGLLDKKCECGIQVAWAKDVHWPSTGQDNAPSNSEKKIRAGVGR